MKNSKLEIKTVKIDKIKPYSKNPRLITRTTQVVKRSIETYGYIAPIVTDKSMVIIAGHARYQALKELGIKEVPVIIKDMPEREAREYRILDNKTQEISRWDDDMLSAEIKTMGEAFKGFDDFFPGISSMGRTGTLIKTKDTLGLLGSKDDIGQREENDRIREREENRAKERYSIVSCPHCDHTFQFVT